MTILVPEYQEASPALAVNNSGALPVFTDEEKSAPWRLDNFCSLISLSGMTKVAVPVSDFVGKKFATLKNVQAVLAGESADVLHVWIMIDEWTPSVRRQVYSIQKLIMRQLGGLHFDFYVIDLPQGTRPEEMVTDIPVIFNRANQESTSANCP
jgi:hypothetical protein